MAETGSVLWAFEQQPQKDGGGWMAKFPQEIEDDAERTKLIELLEALEDNDDVQNVFTNIIFPE